MEDWAQRKNARNLSQKCSYSYDGLFNLDPLVNLQLPQSNSSTLDGMKNKQLRLNGAINGIKAERPVDSQSEMTFKRKRFSVEAEVGCNVVKRDDADSNDEGEGSNGFHIAEEDYRSMLGEHLKKLRRVQLKEAIADRIGSSLNKGMDFVPRRIHLNSKKNHSFRAGWHDQYRVESDEKLPDKNGDGIMMLYENGSYHSNSNTGRNATTVTTDGGDSMPNVIDLGSGILFEIPPPYDELATNLHLPNFQSMQIDDKLLTGHLKPTVVASIVASDPLVKLWKTQARIGAYDKVPVSELSMHAAESKLYDLETGAKKFSLQIFDCSGPQSVTENSSSVGNGADLESLDFKQDSEYTWRGILSENGLVRQWEVRVLQRTDGYEVIERKIPKMEPVKIDPTAVAKEDCDKVAKYWVNLVRKDLPKHHKIFTLYYRKQTLDAKKYAEFCQREVRYKVTRSVKLTRAAPTRIRKLSRDMVIFWKKVDKEQAELKKKEEREAAEALKREEELREARRQQQRLNFLLTQTELYSHFMQNKLAGTAATSAEEEIEEAVPIDQPGDVEVTMMSAEEAAEEAAMKEEALKAAQNAALKQKRKTDDFDSECLKFREITGLEGLSQAVETADGIDLVNPSTMPTASTVQQPSLFQGILKEYQLKGLQWLVNCYEQGLNGILADEMGLGKTIQAMSFLAHLAEEKNIWGPFLVVAPSSVLSNWADEIRRFCPVLKILPYWGALSERTIFRKNLSPKRLYKRDATFHILITSYQLLVTDDKYLRRVKWQYMVLDEAQAIKSANSMRWKTLLSFNCRNRLLLTGTPIQNNMAELWALLHFIMPTLFDNHDQFNEWFSKGIENHAEHGGTLNEHQLNRLHSILKPFMLRRVKKDVITEMSNKKEVVIPCSLSSRQQAFYQAIKNKISISDLFDSSGALLNDKKVMNLMNIVIQLRKVCNHPELFERNEGRTFVHFSVISCSLLPPPFGEPEYIQYAGGHNPIRYQVPKLLYRDGMCCVPTHRSGSIQGFRDRWVHNMLSFFSPANLYASIFMHKAASADATSTAYSGPVGFFCLLDMSISEVGFVARASFMERLLFSWVEEVTCSLEEVVVEDLENVVKESKVRAVNKLLLDPFRHSLSCLRRKLAVGVESEPFEALVVPHQVRFLRNIRLLRSVNTFMPAVRAPQIEVLCTDRGFSYQRGEDLHNPWLKRLFLGHARTSEYNGPAMPGSCHYLIQEKETIIYAQQPFLSLPYRIFGSTPPLQSCDFAKKLTDSGKLQTLDALLKGLRADNHRVLLFAQMTKMLNILEDYMNYRKYKYLRLDGSSSIMDRRDMVNDFQHRSDIFIFLLSTRAGGLGINLTAADTVIFYESDWNPTMDLQAMDRAHRLGQTREVTVYRLICKGTIEEKIVKRASQKNTVQQLVMTGGGQSQGDIFEAEEVVSLLLDDAELDQKMREQVLKPGVKMEKRKRVFGVSSGAKAVRVDAEGIASLEEDIVIEKITEAKDAPENGNKQRQGKRKNDGEGKPPKPPKAPKTTKVNVEASETKSPIELKEFANPKSRSKSRKSLLDACEGNAAYGEHNNSQSAKELSSRTVPVVKVRMPFLKNAKANCNNNTTNNSKMDPRKDATIALLSTQFDANNMGLSPEEYLNDEDLPNPIAT